MSNTMRNSFPAKPVMRRSSNRLWRGLMLVLSACSVYAAPLFTKITITPGDLSSLGTIEPPIDQTLLITTIAATPSGVHISWASLPDRGHIVLYQSILGASSWTNIGTANSIGTWATFTDTNSPRLSQPQGFYRVILVS